MLIIVTGQVIELGYSVDNIFICGTCAYFPPCSPYELQTYQAGWRLHLM